MATQTLLVALVVILGLNQIVARTGSLLANAYLWRALVAIDVVVAAGVFVVGIPGFERMPVIHWAVGALFVMHAGEFLFLREARLRQWGLWQEEDFDTRVARLTQEILGDDVMPGTSGDLASAFFGDGGAPHGDGGAADRADPANADDGGDAAGGASDGLGDDAADPGGDSGDSGGDSGGDSSGDSGGDSGSSD